MTFLVNNQPGDRDRLLDFVGRERKIRGVFALQAVTVPLRVNIVRYENSKQSVILNKTFETSGKISSGDTELDRLIDNLSIDSGIYRISIKTIKDFPELTDTRVEFRIFYISAPK